MPPVARQLASVVVSVLQCVRVPLLACPAVLLLCAAASAGTPSPAAVGTPALGRSESRIGSSAPAKSLPLRPKGRRTAPAADQPAPTPAAPKSQTLARSIVTVIGSLSVVVAIFLAIAWLIRQGVPKGMTALPRDVVEVLGRTQLANRQHVHLVRFGNKLLLISVSDAGAETLAEVTDPADVDRLTGLCGQSKPNSITSSFDKVLHDSDRGRVPISFLGNQGQNDMPLIPKTGALAEERNA